MKKILFCFLLCLSIFYLQANNAICQTTDDSICKLEHLFSFPDDEKSVYIAHPSFMVMDEDSNLVISDNMGCQILKFSLSGKLLKAFGRQGQGPGDLLYPNSICCGDNKIFVTEAGNSRIQIFDTNGSYISMFKVISAPRSMAFHKGKLYAINLSFYNTKEPLIAVYNSHGQILKKFGQLLKFKDNLHPYASNALLKIFNDRLYVLFKYYPLLRIYDPNGKLLKVYNFENMNYESRVPGNYNWKKLKAGNRALSIKFLFTAFDVNRKGIFLALLDNDIIIDYYDHDGNFKSRYKAIHKVEPYYVFDFCVKLQRNMISKFYILNSTDVPKVDVFAPKNIID